MKNYRYRPTDNDIKIRYVATEFEASDLGSVLRGHNKKGTITIGDQVYYFKYDTEKEKLGNMQKPIVSSFCSWLTRRHGGNFVVDVPGEAVVHTGGKESYNTHLKGVFSRSYRDDPNVIATFTLDQVLKPRENESFRYTNEERVFSSVQSSIIRLISFIGDKNNQLHPLFSKLKHLQEDMKHIEEDLVSIVTLDYLFLNNDRHTENIEFAIENKDMYSNELNNKTDRQMTAEEIVNEINKKKERFILETDQEEWMADRFDEHPKAVIEEIIFEHDFEEERQLEDFTNAETEGRQQAFDKKAELMEICEELREVEFESAEGQYVDNLIKEAEERLRDEKKKERTQEKTEILPEI